MERKIVDQVPEALVAVKEQSCSWEMISRTESSIVGNSESLKNSGF